MSTVIDRAAPATPLILTGAVTVPAKTYPAREWDNKRQIMLEPGTGTPLCLTPTWAAETTSTAVVPNVKDVDD